MYAKAVDAVANNAKTALMRKLMKANEAVKKPVFAEPPQYVECCEIGSPGFLRSCQECAVISAAFRLSEGLSIAFYRTWRFEAFGGTRGSIEFGSSELKTVSRSGKDYT